MLRAVRLLNLRRARRQPLRLAIATVAIAAGVALPVSILVLTNSLSQSLDDFGRRLAGPTPLRIIGATSRGGIDESVVATVEATPGVAAAVPLIQAVTLAEPAEGEPFTVVALGVDCRVEQLLGAFGCDPAAVANAPDEAGPLVSRTLGRQLGLTGAIRTDLGRVRAGPVIEQLDTLNAGRAAIFPLPVAQRLFVRPGALDVVYVQPRPGTDVPALKVRLAERVGAWNKVLDATEPPPEIGIVYQIFVPLFTVLAIFGMGVGGVLVYNTLTLSLEERRRQLAITGALGAPPRLVWAGTLAEMAALGLLGGLVGTLGGVALGRPITATLGDFSESLLGVPIDVHTATSTIVIGALLGLVLACLASIVPIRRALRIDVTAELSNRELRAEARPGVSLRRSAVFGGVAAIGLGMCWLSQRNGSLEQWQATTAPIGFLLVILGFMFSTGPLTPALLQGARRRSIGDAGAVRRLGLANVVRDPARTGVMATAVGAAITVAYLTASFSLSVHDGIESDLVRSRRDWVAVSNLDVNNTDNIDAKLAPDLIERIKAVPGVDRVDRQLTVVTGHEPGALRAVQGFDDPWLEIDLILGTKDRNKLEKGDVLIGPALARRTGVRPGDTLRLATRTGFVDVPVQGVWEDGNYNGNSITMDVGHIERLYGPQPVGNLSVRPDPGVSPAELARRLRAAELDPALEVSEPPELVAKISDSVEGQLQPFWAIQRALMLVAFVAVLSTLLLIGVQRKRELGLLAAVGMRPSEMAAMVLSEAGVVSVVATVLSAVSGALAMAGFTWITGILLGFRNPYRLDFGALLLYGALTIIVVLAAAAIPAWRSSRLEVVEALQYE